MTEGVAGMTSVGVREKGGEGDARPFDKLRVSGE